MKQFPQVWEALLPHMGLTAMLRNLGKMTEVGLLGWLSDAEAFVIDRLSRAEALRTARVHPLALLVALKTYAQGHGDKGKLTWKPRQKIVDALDAAFYLSFKTLTPTGARTLLALDVSGSMTSPIIAGMPGITPRVGSAAMALVTAAVEPNHEIVAFTSGSYKSRWAGHGSGHRAGRDLAAHAPRRRHQEDGRPAVRRHGLRAADAVGGRQQGAGRHLLRVHGQRDLGG